MKTHAFIFARGGSKGVPRKNIRRLAGKPLIQYSIEAAQNTDSIEKIFVSTEDAEISEAAKLLGATVINRPAELASDVSPEWLSWQHAIEWVRKELSDFDRFISLPPTCPFRGKEDIVSCLNALDEQTDVVVSMTPSQQSPWFTMVRYREDGMLELLAKPETTVVRRQDAPDSFDLTAVSFVSRPDFILSSAGVWDGKVKGVQIPQDRALDIDTEVDFEIAEALMSKRLGTMDKLSQ